jgi:hypothetical protein
MNTENTQNPNSLAPPPPSNPSSSEPKITDVDITDQNVALNVMVGFLTLAHKRGSFSIEESAKIWECVKRFQS